MGMPAVAITDWGNLYGALHFMKAAKGTNVKPIFGMELGIVVPGQGDQLRHIVLLAETNEGFKNLRAIATRAHTEFGYTEGELRPKLPLDALFENKAGLICLSGGLKGILSSFLLQDQETAALEMLHRFKQEFGPQNFFLEIMETGLSVQARVNDKLIEWSRSEGLGLVACADVHYHKQEDALAQEMWMMVARKMTLEENPRSPLISTDNYLKSPEEMIELFQHVPEAVSNTLAIAERCNVKLKFTDESGKRIYHLPNFESKNESQEELFRKECEAGLKHRLNEVKAQVALFLETGDPLKRGAGGTKAIDEAVYFKRLEYEIGVICKMGFAGYYLIVSDFIRWAKKNEIPVGPGRGSGAGSLAAYALDIIDLDPIEHGLLFERFLNPERVSLPDFDVDFCQMRRGEVIRYVAERYGEDRVCQIVTYAKEQSKNAIKDVGRVLGVSFGETNRVTKLVPVIQGKPHSIKQTLDEVAEVKQIVAADPKMKQVIDLGMKIEGALRQPGVHAAGVIIAGQPVKDLAPLSRDVNGNLITQWDMKMSEEAGLVKFDFLGLVTLDLMDLACRLIVGRHDTDDVKNLTYANVPMHDPRIYKLIGEGDTLGVFQLESSGMQGLCTRIKPDRFEDIAAINALYRPGPLESGMVDDFINRKHGRAKIEVMFPEMDSCLKETYGVILYQEQVQEIARVVAGYTLGGADLLRRAMGKKNIKEMEAQRAAFVDGAVKNGKPATKAGELFDLVEKFAGYGFNKSHAAAYAKLAVQTAFLKAVYPTEFFTALLTIEKEDTDKLSRYIQDARTRGLQILPPDVNESASNFTCVETGVIRFGLSAIKNVGEIAVEAIIEARQKGGAFKNLFDFVSRVDVSKLNKRTVECLIQAGSFDGLEGREHSPAEIRGRYLATVETALEWASKNAAHAASGQFSLFGEADTKGSQTFTPNYQVSKAYTQRELLDFEKLLLGIYVSGSPLDKFVDKIKLARCQEIFSLRELPPKSRVTLAALVTECKEVRIKRGRRIGEMMGILKIEDNSGQIEMVSFPDHYKEFQALFKSGNPLIFRAELDFEEERPKLLGGDTQHEGKLSVEDLAEIKTLWPTSIRMDLMLDRLDGAISTELLYADIAKVLKKYPGPIPVFLNLSKNGVFKTRLDLGAGFAVHPEKKLLEELSQMVSVPGGIKVEAIF